MKTYLEDAIQLAQRYWRIPGLRFTLEESISKIERAGIPSHIAKVASIAVRAAYPNDDLNIEITSRTNKKKGAK